MHAFPREEWVPEFGDGRALEEDGEAECEHVARCDEEDEEDGVPEGANGVETEIEEEDGDFGEGHSGAVDYGSGGCPLGRGISLLVKRNCDQRSLARAFLVDMKEAERGPYSGVDFEFVVGDVPDVDSIAVFLLH